MDSQWSAIAALLAAAVLGMAAYFRVAVALAQQGGSVKTEAFRLPDLWIAIALVCLFGTLVILGTTRAADRPHPIDANGMLLGQVILFVIAELVLGFLLIRGAKLNDLLGVYRLRPSRVAGLALLFVAGALPLAFGANLLVTNLVKHLGDEQEMVTLFRNEVQSGHYTSIVKIAIGAVVLAPVIEEFLFRGFFYAVFKRYMGAIVSALLSSALFALFHGNLASLAGLFIFSLTLTVAYERTGCILVNIGMHSLFNSASLLFLYAGSLPAPAGHSGV